MFLSCDTHSSELCLQNEVSRYCTICRLKWILHTFVFELRRASGKLCQLQGSSSSLWPIAVIQKEMATAYLQDQFQGWCSARTIFCFKRIFNARKGKATATRLNRGTNCVHRPRTCWPKIWSSPPAAGVLIVHGLLHVKNANVMLLLNIRRWLGWRKEKQNVVEAIG